MNKIEELLASSPEGAKEIARAELRVQVSETILLAMEQKGITKSELAAALDVSRSAISQSLGGSRNLSLNLLADMASALGLSIRFEIARDGADTSMPQLAPQLSTSHRARDVTEVQFPAEQQKTNQMTLTAGTADVAEITIH